MEGLGAGFQAEDARATEAVTMAPVCGRTRRRANRDRATSEGQQKASLQGTKNETAARSLRERTWHMKNRERPADDLAANLIAGKVGA